MKKLLLFLLLPVLSYGQVQIGQDIDGEEINDLSGATISLSSDGLVIAISSPLNDGNGDFNGYVRVFNNQDNNWVQIGNNINGEEINNHLGESLSLSSDGSILAISSDINDGNGENSGHVRIFEYDGNDWIQIGQDIDGENENDLSGISISLSSNGSILAIGTGFNDGNGENSGHVRVFENINNSWVQIGEDIDGETIGDTFGNSVSLSSDGSIIAIGATNNDDNGENSGHVRVFKNINNSWVQIGENINGEAVGDRSGSEVSLSSNGSILAIGAGSNDGNGESSGHVRVFENINSSWIQIGEDIDGEAASDRSGLSISLSSDGSVIAIGAGFNDANGIDSGHVRIYQNQDGSWVQVGEDIDGNGFNDVFGRGVDLSSDGLTLAVSSFFFRTDVPGRVSIFDLSDIVLSTQESSLTTFSIFPNPATNEVSISLATSNNLQEVIIYNNLGQKVLTSTQTTIDISSLSSGVYFLEATTSQGKGVQKLLVE